MKVLEVTHSLTSQGGGVAIAIQSLGLALADRGVEVAFAALRDSGTSLPGWASFAPRFSQPAFPKKIVPSADLMDELKSSDLLHSHGLWSAISLAVSSHGRRTRIPWIVSPHGMMDPWALANSRWKKRIAAVLSEDRHLRGAACIHALCQSESDSIRAYGLKNPIAIIPNGVGLPERQGVEGRVTSVESLKKSECKTLLFLGRLHPKKGLVQALKAWHSTLDARRSTPPWQFVIAGWDQGGHEAELKRLATELEIPWTDIRDIEPKVPISAFSSQLSGFSLLFTGAAFGEEKDALLRSADAFILPSLSEGLPMSVLEAWAYGLPVLMTPECNLPEGFAADAAVRIGAEDAKNAESGKLKAESCGNIEGGLHALFEMSDADRVAMGERGRRLVENRFTWPKIAAQMKEVYEWVLGGGPKPGGVFGPVK